MPKKQQSKRSPQIFSVESELLDPQLRLLPHGTVALTLAPTVPGCHLRASFLFRSEFRGPDGVLAAPQFDLAWEVVESRGKGAAHRYGGDGFCCSPYATLPFVAVARFDPQTGRGKAEVDIPLMTSQPMATPLFAGKNQLTVFLALRGHLKREPLGPPENVAHHFRPLTITGHMPSFALVLDSLRLRNQNEITGTVVLDRPAANGETFHVESVSISCGGENHDRKGVRLEKGHSTARFSVRVSCCSCGGGKSKLVRLRATRADGSETYSLPFALLAMAEAPPGTNPTRPLGSSTEWFAKCTQNSAPFNLPPGAVWAVPGDCLPAPGFFPPPMPPPAPGGVVVLYTPYECSFAFDQCIVFPKVINGTAYNKITVFVPCPSWMIGPNGDIIPTFGIMPIDIYTALAPAQAIVDDCM